MFGVTEARVRSIVLESLKEWQRAEEFKVREEQQRELRYKVWAAVQPPEVDYNRIERDEGLRREVRLLGS